MDPKDKNEAEKPDETTESLTSGAAPCSPCELLTREADRLDDLAERMGSQSGCPVVMMAWGYRLAAAYIDSRASPDVLTRYVREDMAVSHRYHELLGAVESKYDGETRHETALRYIREGERPGDEGCQANNPALPPTVGRGESSTT